MDFEVKTSLATAPPKPEETPVVGKMVPGFAVPVINERAVRVAAGLLFAFGAFAWVSAATSGNIGYMKTFGMLFVIDMALRVGLGDRWAPSLILGHVLTMKMEPDWVGANQKLWAWGLGLGMATTFCVITGYTSAPMWVTLTLCAMCLVLLGLEAFFGICVGCKLQNLVARVWPKYTPGGTCSV